MTIRHFLIGGLSTLSLGGALGLPVAEANIYTLLKSEMEKEWAVTSPDSTLSTYLQGVFKSTWQMTVAEVEGAIRGQPWTACISATAGAPQRGALECTDAISRIQFLFFEEQRVRTFGRTMRRTAVSQELPLSEIPGHPVHITTDLSGILNLWRAGTNAEQSDEAGDALLLRTRQITEDEEGALEGPITDLGEAIEVLSKEDQNAVIWRMQYGTRLIRGQRAPDYPAPLRDEQSGPGTERQELFREWPDVEEALSGIWNALPRDPSSFDPPLTENEAAYFLFSDELLEPLPENMLLWARVGGVGENNTQPLGDVGLHWELPLDPLLPALVSSGGETKGAAILGGRYPPEPPENSDENIGSGVCTMALGQRGYLCRPISGNEEELCSEGNTQSNTITLVSCSTEEKPTVTVAGADVCREIEWRTNAPRGCTVELSCGTCAGLAPTPAVNGAVTACIPAEAARASPTYGQIAALVRANQACTLPASQVNYIMLAGATPATAQAQCCRIEGEAYRAMCAEMERDGVFSDLGLGGRVDAQVCGEILANRHCKQLAVDEQYKGCPMRLPYDDTIQDDVFMAMQENTTGAPDSCNEAIAPSTRDPRISARVRTIEGGALICTPGTESTFKNTIGNNLCYIGQCVEESLELHRLTAGRAPGMANDGAFPFDHPGRNDPLATTLRTPPVSSPSLPSYRPQEIVRILDSALCQLQGFPAASPTTLCAFAPSRRLGLPLGNSAGTAMSLLQSTADQAESTALTQALAAALGSRIGTDIQGQYLRIATRTLSEVIALANNLLNETQRIEFPLNMCPLSGPLTLP